MIIEKAKTAGFCFGVARAMEIVEGLLKEGKKVVTLGPLIHNPQVVEDLARRGVVSVGGPAEVPPQTVMVIRSHGVGKEVYDEAAALGVEVVDATCPFVAKIHRIVGKDNPQGKEVVIIGDRDHPEVRGIIGHCSGPYTVLRTEEEFAGYFPGKIPPAGVIMVAQTTFNLLQYSKYSALVGDTPGVDVRKTVCSATWEHQIEAAELSKRCDVCIVIGGKKSSNTKKLFDICAEHSRAFQIETPEELREDMFIGAKRVGITAGASTPSALIEEVLTRMSEITKEEFNFEEALENSLRTVKRGQRVTGIVTEVRGNEVVVDIGTKHTGLDRKSVV